MIEVCGVTKRFGSTIAVDDLSFRVRPGRVTGFLGPNGAGKSTTMRVILGLDAPTSGQALVNGRPFNGIRRPLHELGALLDAGAVRGELTAFAHLLALAQAAGIGRRRVTEVLELTGIDAVARKRVRGFSLGMRQRLGIAAALLGDPPILLFDEPVNGLDPEGIRWIRGLCQSMASQGRTVLVSSHLMSEMALTADHLVVIGRGRLVADTSIADFVRHSTHGYVLVRSPQAARLSRLLRAAGSTVELPSDHPHAGRVLHVTGIEPAAIGDLAAAHGLVIHELTTQNASLEEAFMELTCDDVEYRAAVLTGKDS
jgi:ABC-2 type transport system ATP-binding protein